MALMKSTTVPDDAVSMSELEAIKYVWELVGEWDLADTWALRYGPVFLGSINALSGVLINRHYRNKLKLGTYGYISSVVPITIMPAVLTGLFHRHLISTNMLLMKNECPVCYEIKSSALQLGLGIVYPMILGPTSALLFANRYSTYRVPQILEGPKVMFKFLGKLTRPFNGMLAGLMLIQFLSSSFITYFEMKNNLTIRQKMLAIEEKFIKEQQLKSR